MGLTRQLEGQEGYCAGKQWTRWRGCGKKSRGQQQVESSVAAGGIRRVQRREVVVRLRKVESGRDAGRAEGRRVLQQ